MEAFDPSTFSGRIPIFPLPNVVLFPQTFLPLHILEPRYRAMTRAALAGEKLIGMALLKPGWESDYYGHPPFFDVVGLGRIVQEAELPDGRFNLMLIGLARARVTKLVSDDPYRTAEVEILRETKGELRAESRDALHSVYRRILRDVVKLEESDVPVSILCDLLASVAVNDPIEKQRLLETLDVGKRCERILTLIDRPKPGFPPTPSLN